MLFATGMFCENLPAARSVNRLSVKGSSLFRATQHQDHEQRLPQTRAKNSSDDPSGSSNERPRFGLGPVGSIGRRIRVARAGQRHVVSVPSVQSRVDVQWHLVGTLLS